MHNRSSLLAPGLMGALVFAGCAVGPDYRAPATPTPATFTAAETPAFASTAVEAQWWRLFGDETLDALIRDALARNHDLRLAQARLAEAQAMHRDARWAFTPGGGIHAGVDRGELSEAESGSGPGEIWTAGVRATWEIDLFGRLRRSAEAAAADVDAAAADLRGVQVVLLAEVASTYFGLRGSETALGLVRAQVELLQHSLSLTQRQLDAGRGTPLDTARIEALLHETAALVPALESECAALRHRLAILVGQAPESFSVPPATPRVRADAASAVAIASPADLLRRRPDVARAERELAAATARVGVNTAALFPDVSIHGFFRFVGLDRGELGASGSRGWSVAPTVSWSALDLGRLRAQLTASQARTDGALAAYEQTVLLALEDTENSLAGYRAALERNALLDARLRASTRARDLAQRQYEAGATDPLARLDAERTALAAERDVTTARTNQRLALVNLYRALGGGWETEAAL